MEENKNTLMTQTISNTYTSISAKTMEEKKKLYNALEQCDVLLNDCEDAEIELKDFYVAKYEKQDELTGEIKTKYRTIIFDEAGKSYATGSYGIFNSLRKIVTTFGEPVTWTESLKVKVVKKSIGNGKTSLTLMVL